MHDDAVGVGAMAAELQRTRSAIRGRLQRLGLLSVPTVGGQARRMRTFGAGTFLSRAVTPATVAWFAARLVAESPGEAPERLSAVLDRYRARPVPPDGCERWCDDEILQRAAERVSRVVRSASRRAFRTR